MNTKLRIGGLLIFMLSAAMGQATEFNTPGAWVAAKRVVFKSDGTAELSGELEVLVGKAQVKIDPAKTYRLSGEFRQTQGATSINYLGFIPKDAKKAVISPISVFNVPGTDTEIVENCMDTDDIIKIKDGSKWKKVNHYRVALNAAPDFNDLPNNNLLDQEIKEVTKDGDIYIVKFARPLGQNLAAGTKVRLHSSGGYLYTAGIVRPTPEWQTISGTIKGVAQSGYSAKVWPPGTAYAEVILMLNWNKTNAAPKPIVEFRNIKLEELE